MDLNEQLRKGMAAHQDGDLDTAKAAYEQILDVAPGHADANHLLGLVQFQTGDPGAGAALITKAIELDGKVALYHANLGRVLKSAGRDAEAVVAFKDAIHIEPDTAALHADLASAMIGAGDADGARARANLALELDPNLAEAHLNLGLALQELKGTSDEGAVASFQRAINLKPDLPGSYLGLGVALHENGQSDEAIKAYGHALALDPTFVEAHCNLGNLMRDRCEFDRAAKHYRDALGIKPDQAEVLGNLGVALQESGDLNGALEAYTKAIEVEPDNPEVRRNRGMALLAAGKFSEGWSDYEYRWQTQRFERLKRDWPVPFWDGEIKDGLRLYVHAEQGLGDTLQFCRYLPMLAEQGISVVFECADSLRALMKQVPGVGQVRQPGQEVPAIDAHVSLLSLPGLLGTTSGNIPANIPYLDVPQAYKDKWQKITSNWLPGKRIGIAWRGSPDHARDALRSPGLTPCLPLLELSDTVVVSLQKDGAAEELASLDTANALIDPMTDVADLADTAALMQQLDVVISCDSAPLHLAGGLGVQCFAVLPHVAEWRWGTEGNTSPWYPTMTLVRQPSFGDWASVFNEVRRQLD